MRGSTAKKSLTFTAKISAAIDAAPPGSKGPAPTRLYGAGRFSAPPTRG
jgi:hypothetical protein